MLLRKPSSTIFSKSTYSNWRMSITRGRYYPDLPDGVKPTHIIVGAGSAGCVLANRLTENPETRVLLIEAGPRDDWWRWHIRMPNAYFLTLRNDQYNWFYFTYPQSQLNDRVIYWPRGRVWGGSSSINAMVYIRGHPRDYDRWESEGATGWNFRNCLPYFKRAQAHEDCFGKSDKYRGHDGPLYVSRGKCHNVLHAAFIEAGKATGIGFTDDMNGFKQEGVGQMDLTIKDGERWSSSQAYLKPIMNRPNLWITAGITCTKVLFNGDRAIGVETIPQQKTIIEPDDQKINSYCRENIYCEESVILCAGAINTPQLLMISGIGPGDHLKALGIPVVQDMPAVGNNLQDHLELHIQQKCSKPLTLLSETSWRYPHRKISSVAQWFLSRSGSGASSHLESGGFTRSSPDVEHPDIQMHFFPSTVHNDGRENPTFHGYQLHIGTLRPQSRGILRLRYKDPRRAPFCDPRYLTEYQDLVDLRSCVSLAREIFSQKAFDRFRGKDLLPTDLASDNDKIDEFIRKNAVSAYHQAGTCKMGSSSDQMTVVDPETMNVHGFSNLKVVDASVMPSIVSGNLNAPTIMIAERAADLIMGRKQLAPEEPEIWGYDRRRSQNENGHSGAEDVVESKQAVRAS